MGFDFLRKRTTARNSGVRPWQSTQPVVEKLF